MKRYLLLLVIAFLLTVPGMQAQKKTYFSSSGEMIFSFATLEYTVGNKVYDKGNIVRWSPVFNFQGIFNYDPAKFLGFYTGLGWRNVGFIWSKPESDFKYKYRTYNLGIPIGIKIGDMDGFFIYGGYEIELAFNYKEKEFENESKTNKTVYWFSDRVTQFPQSVMVGINFPYGFNVKFKYYLTNFHNRDYISGYTVLGDPIMPYESLKSNVFYFSLNFGLFSPSKKYYDPRKWDEMY